MVEELLINVSDFETRVAMLRDSELEELHFDRADNYSLTGNIYLGRVVRMVPGMQAAFVDIGLERPGFLHASDIQGVLALPQLKEPPTADAVVDIRRMLHDGQEIMVQIAKDPISSKGARLTAGLAIASRYLVHMPFTDHIGISQRIEDEEQRERLRNLIEAMREELGEDAGFIVRTVAESVQDSVLLSDLKVLARIWRKIKEKRTGAACPSCMYQEIPVHVRIVRDLAGPALGSIQIDHQPTFARVKHYVEEFIPEVTDRVQLYQGTESLFAHHKLEQALTQALDKSVSLPCGGYLIIEQTEAMVTIDVNTGGYLGRDNLEDTVFKTNLEAARAIPRQLRLRNLGGIIVVDFIDMSTADNQQAVLDALLQASELDPARLRIEGFSGLGLVQMSRKRTRESLLQQTCEPCQECQGLGVVRTAETTCIEIFRAISEDARARCGSNMALLGHPDDSSEYLIRASEAVVDRLLEEDSEQLAQLSRAVGRGVRIQVEPIYRNGQFDVVLMQGVRR